MFQYRSGKSNEAAEFLSIIQHGDPGADELEEGDLVCLAMTDNPLTNLDFEDQLRDMARFLAGDSLSEESGKEGSSIRR